MIMKIFAMVATLLALPAMVVAADPIPLKPGLWEQMLTMKSESGRVEAALEQMQQQLRDLPPDQRRMMEDMMANQGISIDAGVSTVQICLTREEIDAGGLAEQEGCEQEVLEQNSERLRLRFVCGEESGEGEVIFHSPESYSGTTKLTTSVEGRMEEMTIDQKGKRLGSDCSALAPGE